MALPINILTGLSAGANSNVNWNLPAFQTTTILDTTFPNFLRNVILTPDGVRVAYGSNTEGINMSDLLVLFATNNHAVTSAPYFSTQPANAAVVHTAGTSFTVVIISELSATYQWQVSTDSGVTWNNITTAGTPVYSGYTTASLSFTTSALGMNGYQYRCNATNAIGTTASTAAILTVT